VSPQKTDFLNNAHTNFNINASNIDISGIQMESPNVDGLEDLFSGTGSEKAWIIKSPADSYVYTSINSDLSNVEVNSASPIKWDVSNYNEATDIRYFKVIADEIGEIPYGKGKYIIAIKDIKLYEDAVYRGEAKLVANDSTDPAVGTTLLKDSLGLLNNVGDIVYKVNDINDNLDTKEKTNARAFNILKELYKDHTQMTVDIIHNPEINIGDTVQVTNSGVLPASESYTRRYLIERYDVTGGVKATVGLSYYP